MKKYSIRILLGILISLFCVLFFNLLINPYDIYRSPVIAGLNAYKSEVERHTRLSKVYQFDRIRPQVIFLASSRGLVVPASYFSSEGEKGYNFSLASASTYELFRMLQHAQAIQPLKKVVIGLDEVFTDTRQPGFVEQRLAVNYDGSKNSERWKSISRDYFSALLSLDAFRASFRTIKKQKGSPQEMGYQEYMAKRVRNAGGHRQMFRNIEAGMFSRATDKENACTTVDDQRLAVMVDAIRYFDSIVDLAYKNNIELFVYFSPVHARFYQAKCITGKWAEMESMKRSVVNIVEAKAKLYGMTPARVMDFSGYSDITMEPVPALGDRGSIMQWYYEGSHFTRSTARLVFSELLNNSSHENKFGVLLTASSIDRHLLAVREGRELYVRRFSEDVSELDRLFNKMVKNKKIE